MSCMSPALWSLDGPEGGTLMRGKRGITTPHFEEEEEEEEEEGSSMALLAPWHQTA